MQVTQTVANAHEAYFARLRTDLALLSNPTIDHQVKQWLHGRSLLDTRNLTYPPPLGKVFKEDSTYVERKAEAIARGSVSSGFLKHKHRKQVEDLVRFMADGQAKQRRAEWTFRTQQAFIENEGWYPFFVTLTVDPKICEPREVWKNGEFQKYIKSIGRDAFRWSGYSGKDARRLSLHNVLRYIATIEHGKSSVHDHVHMLLWLRDIPDSWKRDPNYGRSVRFSTERRCKPLETYWKFAQPGLKPALYYRTINDIWRMECKHKSPVKADGSYIPMLPKEASGRYLAKYMAKEKKEWNHRVRATRNIGMSSVKKLVELYKLEELEKAISAPMNKKQYLTMSTVTSIPLSTIKRLARQVIYRHRCANMSVDDCLETRRKPWSDFVSSVKAGARPQLMTSTQRFIWLRGVLHPDTVGLSEDHPRLRSRSLDNLSKVLATWFPRNINTQVVTVPGV